MVINSYFVIYTIKHNGIFNIINLFQRILFIEIPLKNNAVCPLERFKIS